jgi:glycosyltransferase involved in cell wall biosynthesis|tara:strand:- start:23074 stop:23907 length:834 start_codon:yes stop_codon:yes gene_type:complete
MENNDLTVLMSVYKNDNPCDLKLALQSVIDQSAKANEIILIVDGPVSEELMEEIRSVKKESKIDIHVECLPENVGLASALNFGLSLCQTKYVARMDSDDYSLPNRFEKQLSILNGDRGVDICCSWQGEFESDYSLFSRIKKSPESDAEIKKSLQYRNVISHPTIMFRKKIVDSVGGYSKDCGLLEDWDLYLRLSAQGFQFYCIQVPLVNVRVSTEQYSRRGGAKYLFNEMKFKFHHVKMRQLDWKSFLISLFPVIFFRLSPVFIKRYLYRFVRKNEN